MVAVAASPASFMTPAGHQSAAAVVLDRIHHISFVVVDLDEVVDRMERILGVAVTERGCVPGRQAEVAIFKLANTRLEFVAPATADSPLHQHLAEHGEGFFHIGFAVHDVVRDTAADLGLALVRIQPDQAHLEDVFMSPSTPA